MAPVFAIGDSRTGTTLLHMFLQSAGFKSIHHYFTEIGVQHGNQPTQEETEQNWLRLEKFINDSGFEAFSEYPTRSKL
ncbi:MAG: hypothetical protein AAGC81_01365 [Pseudomonadota bacterium]